VCSACGAAEAGSEKKENNTRPSTEAAPVSSASASLPAQLKIDTEETAALTAKLVGGGATSAPALFKSLTAPATPSNATERIATIRALARLGNKDAVPILVDVVKSPPFLEEAEEAWTALGQLAGPEVIGNLMFILETPLDMPYRKLVVQVAAMKALTDISAREGGSIEFVQLCSKRRMKASPAERLHMVEVLQKLDTNGSRNLLLSLLSDPDANVKRVTLAAITRADDPQLIGKVLTFLTSPNPQLKKEAVLALGRCKSLASVPALINLIDSSDSGMRATVIGALRSITGRAFASTDNAKLWIEAETADGEQRLAVMQDMLKNESLILAPMLVEEIGKLVLLRDKETMHLRSLANHTNFRVRAAACTVLGQATPNLQTIGILIGKLGDSSEVVTASAWRSLKSMTGQTLPNKYEAWNQWFMKRG